MTSNSTDESMQRPHKRTGVWANETVKTKTSTDSAPKRFSRKHISDIVSGSTESDELPDQIHPVAKNIGLINRSSMKSRLLKLPALNSFSGCNLALLLNEFNEESEVQENDSPWTQDSLFAELTAALNQKLG